MFAVSQGLQRVPQVHSQRPGTRRHLLVPVSQWYTARIFPRRKCNDVRAGGTHGTINMTPNVLVPGSWCRTFRHAEQEHQKQVLYPLLPYTDIIPMHLGLYSDVAWTHKHRVPRPWPATQGLKLVITTTTTPTTMQHGPGRSFWYVHSRQPYLKGCILLHATGMATSRRHTWSVDNVRITHHAALSKACQRKHAQQHPKKFTYSMALDCWCNKGHSSISRPAPSCPLRGLSWSMQTPLLATRKRPLFDLHTHTGWCPAYSAHPARPMRPRRH